MEVAYSKIRFKIASNPFQYISRERFEGGTIHWTTMDNIYKFIEGVWKVWDGETMDFIECEEPQVEKQYKEAKWK